MCLLCDGDMVMGFGITENRCYDCKKYGTSDCEKYPANDPNPYGFCSKFIDRSIPDVI